MWFCWFRIGICADAEWIIYGDGTDRCQSYKAEGEADDIAHGIPFGRPMKIYAGNYDDVADAAIIVITAGANQKPDETRLDCGTQEYFDFSVDYSGNHKERFRWNLLIVANPVTQFTYTALKMSDIRKIVLSVPVRCLTVHD